MPHWADAACLRWPSVTRADAGALSGTPALALVLLGDASSIVGPTVLGRGSTAPVLHQPNSGVIWAWGGKGGRRNWAGVGKLVGVPSQEWGGD